MKFNKIYSISILTIFLLSSSLSGCKKFVEVPDPIDQIPSPATFSSDSKASSAVRGLYGVMLGSSRGFLAVNSGFAAGITLSLSASSDELQLNSGNMYSEFFDNNIAPASDTNGNNLWGPLYNVVFHANAIIENLATSTGVTDQGRKQLTAEAKFIRALNYFYLVNMYGNIPMPIATDYRVNVNLPNLPASEIYDLIISDLKYAQEYMPEAYPGLLRSRANKYAASALLARVYLYRGDWANAEAEASLLLTGKGKDLYNLEGDLNKVFLTTSKEVILQMYQPGTNLYTWDGYSIISSGIPQYQVTPNLFDSFENNDKRKTQWIKTNTITNAGTTNKYYHPFKYKLNSGTGTVKTEALVFLRLAEVYLIRAEARAKQSKLKDAIEDLDAVRIRAGIDPVDKINPDISQPALLDLIAHERFVELFTEMGHRWFDLKRTEKADEVLKYKSAWRPEAKLFPIPLSDTEANPLLKQNPGYN